MLDLILRGCNLPDSRKNIDIGIKGGKIIEVAPNIAAKGAKEINASGRLVSPPFVDAHFHLDATLSYGIPRVNKSGTLLEGIQLWGELKPLLTKDAVKSRAREYCHWAIARGLLAIRSHIDICDPRLLAVEALLEIREEMKEYIDIQYVAFPQDGYYRFPGAVKLLERALDMGVDVVGGIPHFERTMADGADSMKALCEIAAKRNLLVDIHCDESDDPMSRHIEALTYETQRLGLHGRVAGSHLTSMHSMDNYYASKLLALMAEAKIHAIPNPLANMWLMGRHDTYPKRRGLTRIKEMRERGINVALGQDSTLDPWYSLGSGEMLEVAHMAIHAAHMTSIAEMTDCFYGVTYHAAKAMHLEGYGLEAGCNADLVVLQASDPIEAIRLKAPRLYVMRRGKIIAQTPEVKTELLLRQPTQPVQFLHAKAA
ncbi:MAG: amidohydrolase family protein [Dongiaceae bacterium]